MATFSDVNLEETSTVTSRLAAVSIQRNSTVQKQEVMVIGDPDSTTTIAVAKVTNIEPDSTVWGIAVRPVRPVLLTANSTAGSDSLAVIVAGSSVAGADRKFITAFTVISTISGPIACGFYSQAGGASSLVWPVTMWAGGGVVQAFQAVNYPAYLFATSTGSTLTFQVASTGPYRVAVTYSTGA